MYITSGIVRDKSRVLCEKNLHNDRLRYKSRKFSDLLLDENGNVIGVNVLERISPAEIPADVMKYAIPSDELKKYFN